MPKKSKPTPKKAKHQHPPKIVASAGGSQLVSDSLQVPLSDPLQTGVSETLQSHSRPDQSEPVQTNTPTEATQAESRANSQPTVNEPAEVPTPSEISPAAQAKQQPTVSTAEVPTKPATSAVPRPRKFGRRMIIAGVSLLILVVSLQAYSSSQQGNVAAADQSTVRLIAEVSERAVLPTDEKPSITTVVDPSKLNQTFLQNAREGDKVLLFFQAGKAIVYRPSSKQIVNIGPLSQPTSKVFLRNGTASNSIPTSVRDKLSQNSDYTIVSQDVATKRSYVKNMIVDLTGNRPDIAKRLARQFNGVVSELPVGETRPDADFIIIIGSDSL